MTADPHLGTATDDPLSVESAVAPVDAALLDPLLAWVGPDDAVADIGPDDTDFLGHHPGLHLLAARTLHAGRAG